MAIEPTQFSQMTRPVTMSRPAGASTIKLLAVVEATTVNAVAKNVLEFHRAARDLRQESKDLPGVELSLVTFDRNRSVSEARPQDPQPGSPAGVGRSGRASSDNEFVLAAQAAGVEIDVIPERKRFDRSVIPALRDIVQRRSPDIVITHQVKSHFLMRLSRLWQAFPWVAFHHGYTTTDQKMRLYNRLNRWSLPKADRVITVCEAFASELANAGVNRERISVQHNSIRPEPRASDEEVQALKARLGISEGECIVLAVGRLSKEKAQIDLFHAFKHLGDINPKLNAKLVVVGDGPERGSLEATALTLGISGRVIFAGQVRNVQLYYAAANVLANPSHSEGSPYVLLEATAAGLPIIATSVGGVPDMVEDHESALLVPARDPQAMAAAIARVLTDAHLAQRLSANASTLLSSRFPPEAYVRSLVETYQEAISTSHKRSLG
jgi:glycosyltransferase involved in cell wall biosynthesis